MKPTIAIIAPGAMGAAIARRLVANGLVVRTSVAGRSEATVQRASAAGMTPGDEDSVCAADIILSIVPPKDAVTLARRLAEIIKRSGHKPVYVDCNAINPDTVAEIGGLIDASGAYFVDGSIIGMPPVPDTPGPALYVSGQSAGQVAVLSDYGLRIRVLDAPIGAASALKMAYGGITKGLTAIGSAMILGAEKSGVAQALVEEMAYSQPNLLAGFTKSIPDMFPKAGRWVAEMEEIAKFVGAERPQGAAYRAIAAFYTHLAGSQAKPEIDALSTFVQRKAKP